MATAVGTYASVADVKARLDATGNVSWADSQTTILTSLCNQVNSWIESYTGRILAPDPTSSYTLCVESDEAGTTLAFPRGIRALTKLEVKTHTGGPWNEIPSTDFFLQPDPCDLGPGWPYTEVQITNIPSAGTTTPYFYPGFDVVRLTGSFGWSAVPDEITDLALNLVVAKWRARSAGGGDTFTIGADGERTFERMLSWQDRQTISRYKIKTPIRI